MGDWAPQIVRIENVKHHPDADALDICTILGDYPVIIRCRYVNKNGVAQALNPDKSQPEGTFYWTEKWKGPESIVYGHCVHDLTTIRIDVVKEDVHCIGIDTGCCFGGHLTALYLDREYATAAVKAKKKYYEGYGDE